MTVTTNLRCGLHQPPDLLVREVFTVGHQRFLASSAVTFPKTMLGTAFCSAHIHENSALLANGFSRKQPDSGKFSSPHGELTAFFENLCNLVSIRFD
jgi:hypothetical protein